MLQVEEKRARVIESHTRSIAQNIDEAIVSSAFTIINVMGVIRRSESEEVLVQDILTHLHASMQGLSAVKASFLQSLNLMNGSLLRE